jgi:sigma-B regulation protein RsbU (phosphoserine phosphatase)
MRKEMSKQDRVLIVDDEEGIRNFLRDALEPEYTVLVSEDGKGALDSARRQRVDVAISDIKMREMDGIQVLKGLKGINPDVEVIMLTAYASADSAIEALRLGAYDYITKPSPVENIRRVVRNALGKQRLLRENRELVKSLQAFSRELMDKNDLLSSLSGELEVANAHLREAKESLQLRVLERTAQLEEERGKLQKRVRELSALNQASRAMGAVFDLDELLDLMIDLIARETEAQRGSIMLIDPPTNELVIKAARGLSAEVVLSARPRVGEGFAGWVAEKGEPLFIDDVEEDPRFRGRTSDPQYSTKSLLCVPLMAKGEVIGVININNKLSGYRFTREDLDLVTTLAAGASLSIENARLHQELTQRERMKRELEIARKIQESFLPWKMPHIEGFEISAMSVPAEEVGGDYYDFVPVDEGHWGIAIGDVSGKGVPAAIYMAMARSVLRAQAVGVLSAGDVLSNVNRTLSQDMSGTTPAMFLTAFYIVLDTSHGRVAYANAGHGPPILYRRREGRSTKFGDSGMVMGVMEDFRYHEGELTLEEGDVILLYTDGSTEARNRKGDMFGFSRLCRLLEECPSCSAQEVRDHIHRGILGFTEGSPQYDDLTLMVIKMR